jgi:hypothetical protein
VALASSGLEVVIKLLSGPCTLASNLLSYTGAGECRLTASQAGNGEWKPVSTVVNIKIEKAPQVFTFLDKTIPWRPERNPIKLWATLPSGAGIRYELVDHGEPFPPCRIDGTSVIVGAVTVPSSCDVVAIQDGSDPDYLDAPSMTSKLNVDYPQWVWSYDFPPYTWNPDNRVTTFTIFERTGTAIGVELLHDSGTCVVEDVSANASRTEFTVTVRFGDVGTCSYTVIGQPSELSIEGASLNVTITAAP